MEHILDDELIIWVVYTWLLNSLEVGKGSEKLKMGALFV